MRSTLIPAALLAALLAASSARAASPRPACPAGHLQQVRVSEIVEGGSIAGFRAALADHAKWYADHGYRDRFEMGQVLSDNASRNRRGKPGLRVVTLHSAVSEVPREKQDEAWKAFVARYRENSRIVSTTLSCVA